MSACKIWRFVELKNAFCTKIKCTWTGDKNAFDNEGALIISNLLVSAGSFYFAFFFAKPAFADAIASLNACSSTLDGSREFPMQ